MQCVREQIDTNPDAAESWSDWPSTLELCGVECPWGQDLSELSITAVTEAGDSVWEHLRRFGWGS